MSNLFKEVLNHTYYFPIIYYDYAFRKLFLNLILSKIFVATIILFIKKTPSKSAIQFNYLLENVRISIESSQKHVCMVACMKIIKTI